MNASARPRRVVIMGAAGRDFHNFNVRYRNNPAFEIVAFTAAQIPNISGRRYPPSLSGERYPDGIPIESEGSLAALVQQHRVDEVVFAYSDVPHIEVMHRASIALAAGATFTLLGPNDTMLAAPVPTISICAVRTGAGKSPVSRWVLLWLTKRGIRAAVVRHPMPYGDLERQAVQHFRSPADLDAARTSFEEREEYEPYLRMGATVHAGVDYERIVREACRAADVLVWDGGNNDLPFVRPDLHVVLVDPLRPGHEIAYHPGEANLRMADAVVISKYKAAAAADIHQVRENVSRVRPGVPVIRGDLEILVDLPDLIRGRRVVIVEDGPTLTHGGMSHGAGTAAARLHGAAEIVNARRFAAGSIAETFAEFPHLTGEVPAMGYDSRQVADLTETLDRTEADVVIDATPVRLSGLLKLNKPIVNVDYEFADLDGDLERALTRFFDARLGPSRPGRQAA